MAAKPQTICQLVHGLPVGGAEVLVDRFTRCFSRDYRVVIACLDHIGELGERLATDGYKVALLSRRPGFDWGCVRRLAAFCRRERVDLVHAHQYTPFAYALASRAVGARPRVLFTEHGRFFPDYPSRKRMWFNRLMSRGSDRYIAVGGAVRQALVDNEGLPAERVEVVYNGVDLDQSASPHDRNAARAELGVAADEFLVLQVARLDPIKDHPTAIEATRIARAQEPRLRLMIVGEGSERGVIESLIRERGLHEVVELLGLRRDVPRLLSAADAFLLTSVSEGIPVTVIEAMGAGVPVVSTSVGGVTEVITDGETGLLAPAGDADKLAEALLRVQTTPELAANLAQRAREDAHRRFSEQQMLDCYANVYRDMLSGQRRPHDAPNAAKLDSGMGALSRDVL